MSVRVMTAVWALDLPDSEKIVLLALADCANDEGHCWPSIRTLTAKCSKTDRTIQLSIKRLVDGGHLTRREVPGKGCNYTVHPRSDNTPEAASPPKGTTQTPEATSDKPSRTVNTEAKASLGRVVDHWNLVAKKQGWSEATVLDASRRQTIRLRTKAHGEDELIRAIDCLARVAWVREKVKAGKWKPHLDYFLRPETIRTLLEGTFQEDEEREVSQEQRRDADLRTATLYDRMGRTDEAEELRRRWNTDGPVRPLGSIAQKILGEVRPQ